MKERFSNMEYGGKNGREEIFKRKWCKFYSELIKVMNP